MEQVAADVVVIGTGPGGMAAVAAAIAEGAEVIAVETMDHIGGNAVWSTGYLAFVGSQMQLDAGIEDQEETFVADARAVVEQAEGQFGIEWDEELVRLFARESAETYRLLTERGVCFSRFIPRPRQHTVDRDGRRRRHLDAGPRVRAGLCLAAGPDPVRHDGRPAAQHRGPGHQGPRTARPTAPSSS